MSGIRVISPVIPRASELRLVYQPIVDVAAARVCGAESLVRWHRPDGRVLLPGSFLDAVEREGHMPELSDEVMRRALADLRGWDRPSGRRDWWMTVNLSASELHDVSVVDRVATALERMDVSPRRLVIDVTHAAALNVAQARLALYGLRDLGVGVALDDIGDGVASLARLADVPVSLLKLPQRFLDAIQHDGPEAPMAHGILSLASELGLPVVAAGVETEAQRRELVHASVRYAQGFLFTPPVSHERLRQMTDGLTVRLHPPAPAAR